MPRFQFEAANQAGQVQSGAMEAESVRAVRLQLRDRGLTALEVRETQSGGGQSWFSPKLGAADLCWVTRELASLLSARLPLESAALSWSHENSTLIVQYKKPAAIMKLEKEAKVARLNAPEEPPPGAPGAEEQCKQQ